MTELTELERAYAEKLGLSPEQYAKGKRQKSTVDRRLQEAQALADMARNARETERDALLALAAAKIAEYDKDHPPAA